MSIPTKYVKNKAIYIECSCGLLYKEGSECFYCANIPSKLIKQDHEMTTPKPNTEWVHKTSGEVYTVKCVTNEKATKPDYVITVVYVDEDDVIWSRPLSKWYDSFVELRRKNKEVIRYVSLYGKSNL